MTDGQKNKTIDGVTYTKTYSGQKEAYGDSYYEYDVTSNLPAEAVEHVCREKVYKAIPYAEWLLDYRNGGTMEQAFRPHYKFKVQGDGKYFYQVCQLYTD